MALSAPNQRAHCKVSVGATHEPRLDDVLARHVDRTERVRGESRLHLQQLIPAEQHRLRIADAVVLVQNLRKLCELLGGPRDDQRAVLVDVVVA